VGGPFWAFIIRPSFYKESLKVPYHREMLKMAKMKKKGFKLDLIFICFYIIYILIYFNIS